MSKGDVEMTELKTLKDFDYYDGVFIELKELKKEAIKWVKERMLQGSSVSEDIFWMDKFNISEEDLKKN